jgi:hypothetical protein
MKVQELFEGVAEPFKKFRKGQIVTVIKTGKKVEVLSQNDIGLVQTVLVDGGVKSFPKGKGSVVQGKDHQEYMPRELQEGWFSKKKKPTTKCKVGDYAWYRHDGKSGEGEITKIVNGEYVIGKATVPEKGIIHSMIEKPKAVDAPSEVTRGSILLKDRSPVREGLFSKKKESKNEPITDEDRKLITSVFKSGHNANLKSGGEPLFPQNVHVVTDTKHITFYKRNGQLKATVGHHRPGEAGNPKARPATHTDHDISSVEDLKAMKGTK